MSVFAVTGGTGFVGSHLIDLAVAQGHAVRALTRRPQPSRDGVIWIAGDLGDADALAELARGADAVIHIAGAINAPDRAGFDRANVAGTQAVLTAAAGAGVRRFVHISSLAAREPGLSMYGASKARSEEVVRGSALDWTIVRPPAIYGPRDHEMLELFRMAARGVVLLPPGGRLSVIAVEDLCRLLLALAASDAPAGVLYEPDDGVARGWDHKDFARALGVAVGRKVVPVSMPGFMLSAASVLERLIRRTGAKLTADRVRYYCHPDWVATPHATPPATMWRADIATAAGLAATARWYRAAGWLRG